MRWCPLAGSPAGRPASGLGLGLGLVGHQGWDLIGPGPAQSVLSPAPAAALLTGKGSSVEGVGGGSERQVLSVVLSAKARALKPCRKSKTSLSLNLKDKHQTLIHIIRCIRIEMRRSRLWP